MFRSYLTDLTSHESWHIEGMNGFDTKHGKLLKVTIKKGEESYNPDAVAAQNLNAGDSGPPQGTPALVGVEATVALTGVTSKQLQEAAEKGKILKAGAAAPAPKPLAILGLPP